MTCGINITDIANDINKQNIFGMVIEEACRQWCEFIDEAPERKDGEGFENFFYEIFKAKEQEYLEAYNESKEGIEITKHITTEDLMYNQGGYDALVQYKCYVFVAKLSYHGRYGAEIYELTDKADSHGLSDIERPLTLIERSHLAFPDSGTAIKWCFDRIEKEENNARKKN